MNFLKALQGVHGELIHRQLGHERVKRWGTASAHLFRDHRREKLPWVSTQHTNGDSCTSEDVELQVDVLVSVRPSDSKQ